MTFLALRYTADLYAISDSYPAYTQRFLPTFPPGLDESPHLRTTDAGRTFVVKIYEPALKRVNIEGITWHTVRHPPLGMCWQESKSGPSKN